MQSHGMRPPPGIRGYIKKISSFNRGNGLLNRRPLPPSGVTVDLPLLSRIFLCLEPPETENLSPKQINFPLKLMCVCTQSQLGRIYLMYGVRDENFCRDATHFFSTKLNFFHFFVI